MDDLTPCPYHDPGGGALLQIASWQYANIWQVHCNDCGAAGPFGTSEEEAIRLWNTRLEQADDGS